MTKDLTLKQALTGQVVCRGLAPGEEHAYLSFAQKAWGADSVQATTSRIKWLYEANPNSKGMKSDLLVLWYGDKIVGAHHRMRLPWCLKGQRVTMPSLHDLAVLPDHRKGEGVQLIFAALDGEPHVALFGLNGIADEIYNRIRVPKLEMFWLEKNRNPLVTGLRVLKSRARSPKEPSLAKPRILHGGFEVCRTSAPSEEEMSEALSLRPSSDAYIDWDLPSFRWRFFDKEGPRNILLLARLTGRIIARAILSFGLRHGVIVARLVDVMLTDKKYMEAVVEMINQTISELKVSFAFFATSSREIADAWVKRGWSNRKNPPGARWFSSDKSAMPQQFWIHGGAWDFGCDKRVSD